MSLPSAYRRIGKEQPRLLEAYERFGEACAKAGPLDVKTIALVKLAISLGAGLEGAAHSHCRKALAAGWTADELMHVAHLCAPTIGFPPMMRNRGWVQDVVEKGAKDGKGGKGKGGGKRKKSR